MSNAASAGEVNVGKRELIAPLLPSAPGRTACFRGVFKPVTVDTERYGTGTGQNEPVPYIYTTYRLDALTLQLEYTCTPPRPSSNDDPGYDRRYAFLLSARFAGQKPQFAAGDCDWHDRDLQFDNPGGKDHLPRNTKALHCGIECDGGLMSLVRVKGVRAISFTVDPRRHLRLSAGCDSKGRSLTLSGHDAGIALDLVPADAAACRPLERWRKRQ